MRKIVVSEFISVDGVIEDPGGSEGFARGGWAFRFDRGAEGDKFKLDEVLEADALLLGRRTYEGFAEAWPSRTDDVGFADKMNRMPKYVVSSTLQTAPWNDDRDQTRCRGCRRQAQGIARRARSGQRQRSPRQRPDRTRPGR